MLKSNRWFVWVCVAVILCGAGFLYAVNKDWFPGDTEPSVVKRERQQQDAEERQSILDDQESLAQALRLTDDEMGTVGGVIRPKRDVASRSGGNDANNSAIKSVTDSLPPSINPGRAPRLTGTENSQVAGMVAEMKGAQEVDVAGDAADDTQERQNGPQIVTSWAKPEPFDKQAYESNPNEYLNKIRPARVFSPAQPGEGVTPLESVSSSFQNILQGEQVILRVKAAPSAPVAFYSRSTGSFENLLTSITVKADDKGIATATYKTGPGSMGVVNILAASPVHSRQLQYQIRVDLPQQFEGQ